MRKIPTPISYDPTQNLQPTSHSRTLSLQQGLTNWLRRNAAKNIFSCYMRITMLFLYRKRSLSHDHIKSISFAGRVSQ